MHISAWILVIVTQSTVVMSPPVESSSDCYQLQISVGPHQSRCVRVTIVR